MTIDKKRFKEKEKKKRTHLCAKPRKIPWPPIRQGTIPNTEDSFDVV